MEGKADCGKRPLFLAELEIGRFFYLQPVARSRVAEFDSFGMQAKAPGSGAV